jgi:hypothetical protein
VMLQPWSRILDVDRDGDVSDSEGWAGLAGGMVDLKDRIFGQYLDAAQAVTREFSTGFSSMDRDGGMYLFVQRKAPVFFCASWDAGTVVKLAKDRFRIAFGSIPIPGPGEPWNVPPRMAVSEADTLSWGAYHINRDGKVAEAIDFMRYWTSYAVNQRFNRQADWIPAIIGTSPSPEMAAFAPRIAGQTAAWSPASPFRNTIAGQTALTLQGQMAAFITGEASKEEVIRRTLETYQDPNYGSGAIWAKDFTDLRSSARNQERAIGVLGAAALADGRWMEPTVIRDLLWSQIPLYDGHAVRWRHRQTIGADVGGRPGKPFPEVEP